jgi:integrase
MPQEAWRNAEAVGDYEAWLASVRREKSDRTADDYARTVRDLLAAHPQKETHEFTTADCQRLLDGSSPGSRRPRKAALRSFFRPLYLEGRIPTNPVERVKVPTIRRRRHPDVFTDAELTRLYGLDPPDGPLFVLMVECGLYKRECRGLRRRDIELERGYLVVRSRRDEQVPLTVEAGKAVRDLDAAVNLAPRDYLWWSKPGGGNVISRERPIGNATFQRWFSEGLRKAGVPHREPRTTRSTFVQRTAAGAQGAVRSSVNSVLLRRLEAISPQLAASYTQVHLDLADEARVSFLGPAGEIREVMRGAMTHLAPDDDVRAHSWYVGHEGRPTQVERIRHILESRPAAAGTATHAAEIADEKTAKLGRALYGRASRALHAGTQREEVVKIVFNVEAVLIEILPP